MKMIIKQIVIFNENGEKRSVPFNEGLNIITGDSKTGKSALIEIVDYCLFSSRSSIPKGKITQFATLFVVIFQVKDFYLVVGRPAPDKGNPRNAYLKVEFDYDYKLKDISYSYFSNISLRPIQDDVQTEFERYLGLSLGRLETEDEANLGKLSIRDTASFLFQHQNLIANKHALFYRFEDYNKKKRVIEAVPVLFGEADEKFYDLNKKFKQLKSQIQAEERFLERVSTERDKEKVHLQDLIQLYFSMLGRTLEENLPLEELKRIGSSLPEPPEFLGDQTKLYSEIIRFNNERELKYSERDEIEKALSSLIDSSDEGLDYVKELIKVNTLQKYNEDKHLNASCPVCERPVEQVNSNVQALNSSKERLIAELQKLSSFSKDNTELISRLRNRKKELDGDIYKLTKFINQLSLKDEAFQNQKSRRDNLIYRKGVIENTIKGFLEFNHLKGEFKDLQGLRIELNEVSSKLSKYNLNSFYESAESALKSNMDRIASNLDFEPELMPINFYFKLSDFSFYHENKGKIRLDEMGSGANWLACHLSIFLSFLHLTCSYGNSVIPSFLMIDQPSQVYFPKTANKNKLEDEERESYDDNIEQVKNIFKVLNEEIILIKENTGIKPQIIVLEHANDDEFEEFILKEWDKSKGEGLI